MICSSQEGGASSACNAGIGGPLGGVAKEGFWETGERRMYCYYFTPHELRTLLEDNPRQHILGLRHFW